MNPLPFKVSQYSVLVDSPNTELGGVALYDTSEGNASYLWELSVNSLGEFTLTREGNSPEYLFTQLGTQNQTLSFDANMHPVIAWEDAQGITLRWYSPLTHQNELLSLTDVRSPMLILDDKRQNFIGNSDVILFYLRNTQCYCRLQRDRYIVEYYVCDVPITHKIAGVGIINFRLHINFEVK